MLERYDRAMDTSQMTEEEWKKLLSPEEYAVLREGATETPFSGKYVTTDTEGMYHCRACKALLFSSDKKLDSSESGPGLHGWPSFSDPAVMEHIGLRPDTSHGMVRTEVFCKNCGSHLGHVFDETVENQDRQHYCINSVALEFEKRDTNPS